MLKIENAEVLGLDHAIRGMQNPMNSWEKSDSEFITAYGDHLVSNGVMVQEWISVDDRLPDVGNIVLIYSETDGVCLGSYSDDTFDYFDVTHWMSIPQPPKGDVHNE